MHPRPLRTSGALRHPRLPHLAAAFARANAQAEAAQSDKQVAQAQTVPAASAA